LADTRLILRAIVGLDRWSFSTKPGLQADCSTKKITIQVVFLVEGVFVFFSDKKPPD